MVGYGLDVLKNLAGHLWRECIVSNIWRTIAVLFLLANLKVLPLMWHVRLFSILTSHIVTNKSRVVNVRHGQHPPKSLFAPVITTSSTPLMELDFNMHKSNSTFFSDLDLSRIQTLAALFKTVINPALKPGPTKDGKLGGLKPALGGVSCVFRREIKLFQEYEIWTRVLCWDDKWLYLVSHFVKKGASKPAGYILGDSATGRTSTGGARKPSDKGGRKASSQKGDSDEKNSVLASSISKYVFKQGRKSIPPAAVLEELCLLPADDDEEAGEIKRLNEEGLKIATSFAALDGLHDTFTAGRTEALGKFSSWPF